MKFSYLIILFCICLATSADAYYFTNKTYSECSFEQCLTFCSTRLAGSYLAQNCCTCHCPFSDRNDYAILQIGLLSYRNCTGKKRWGNGVWFIKCSESEYNRLISIEKRKLEKADRLVEIEKERRLQCQEALEEISIQSHIFYKIDMVQYFLRQLIEDGSIGIDSDIQNVLDKYALWEMNFLNESSVYEPNWSSIDTDEAYQIALNKIGQMRASFISNDSAFENELVNLTKKIEVLISGLDAYADIRKKLLEKKEENDCVNVEDIFSKIRDLSNFSSYSISIDAIFDSLSEVKKSYYLKLQLLNDIGYKKRKLVKKLYNEWENYLSEVYYYGTAYVTTSDFREISNADMLYTDVQNKIERKVSKISKLLDLDYCPFLALRELRTLKVMLDDIERNVNKVSFRLPKTDSIPARFSATLSNQKKRSLIRVNLIQGARDRHDRIKSLIGNFSEDELNSFQNERKKIMESQLADTLDEDCKKMAELSHQQENVIDSEITFKKFIEQCYRK